MYSSSDWQVDLEMYFLVHLRTKYEYYSGLKLLLWKKSFYIIVLLFFVSLKSLAVSKTLRDLMGDIIWHHVILWLSDMITMRFAKKCN